MKYEIINHGWDNCQYFQGCGASFTEFDECVTGCGMDAVEAYNDALESIAQSEEGCNIIDKFPKRPRGYGITMRNKVPSSACGEDSDCYWYVSIRYSK